LVKDNLQIDLVAEIILLIQNGNKKQLHTAAQLIIPLKHIRKVTKNLTNKLHYMHNKQEVKE